MNPRYAVPLIIFFLSVVITFYLDIPSGRDVGLVFGPGANSVLLMPLLGICLVFFAELKKRSLMSEKVVSRQGAFLTGWIFLIGYVFFLGYFYVFFR